MGGLKKDLPITYWTFLIGALAIAGVPGLAGFFSKDEILFRTFAGGHTLMWSIGLITSLLTAIYMFRLVFLAFHGSPAPGTHDVPGAHDAPGTHAPDTHAPGTHAPGTQHSAPSTHRHVHDAPPAMAIALIVLAVGSVAAGYVGVPAALGGSNRLEHFLEPSLHLEAAHDAGDHTSVERTLMVVSSGVALAGIGIALYFFLRNRGAAARLSERFSGAYRLLLNKYYVDEIYDAAVVQPIRIVSEEGLWKIVDVRVIDRAVNAAGEAVIGWSELLRRLQTGSVRAYAASLFFGVVSVLGYYLWR
jgi:NADH-quinone oxidoreductase subunit L